MFLYKKKVITNNYIYTDGSLFFYLLTHIQLMKVWGNINNLPFIITQAS